MKPQVILDANAFIHSIDFGKLYEKFDFISTASALKEVKDQQARQRLNQLPYDINVLEPSETSLKFVQRFARATGDISSISSVDLELIALAYTILEQNKNCKLVRQTPSTAIEFNKIKNNYPKIIEQSKIIENKQDNKNIDDVDDDEWETVVEKKKFPQINAQNKQNIENQQNQIQIKSQQEKIVIEQEQEQEQKQEQEQEQEQEQVLEETQDTESDDDEQGWITDSNIQDHLTGVTEVTQDQQCETQKFGVAIVTADYSMQNVLLQMGIPIISQEGMIVKHARRFILECHICKVLIRDHSKLFCSQCGNNSLLKVSCSYNSDGTIILYRKRNFQINNRGQNYQLPKNKANKHEQFIRTEDQLLMGGIQQRIKREQRAADQKFKKMMLSYENGFGFEDIDYKQQKDTTKLKVGFGKLNPNDVNDMRKIKSSQKK